MRRTPVSTGACLLATLFFACFPDPSDLRKQTLPGPGTGGATGGAGDGGTPDGRDGPPPGTGGGGMGGGGTGGAAGGAGGVATPDMGGTIDAPTTPVESREQACASFARTLAATAMRCSRFLVEFQYGSQAQYEARLLLNCRRLDVPGSNFPPRPFAACAAALSTLGCHDWYEGNTPAACVSVGSFADGTPCTTGDQCRSNFCDLSIAGNCGRCTRLPTAGQPCLMNEYCQPGHVCNPAGTCVVPGDLRAPCSQVQPCRASLSCLAGTCQTSLPAGATCTTDADCAFAGGVVCNDELGRCVPVSIGNPCRLNTDGSYVFCGASSRCSMNTCIPAAGEGQPCKDPDGARCLWPLFCNNAGTCQLSRLDATCGPAAAARGSIGSLDGALRGGGLGGLPIPMRPAVREVGR